jgi:hypothetical protein
MSTVTSESSRRCAFGELESIAVATRRRRRRFQQLLRHLRLPREILAWAFGSLAQQMYNETELIVTA